MYRLIFILILLIVLYFLIRSAVREWKAKAGQGQLPVDRNQMVQDPMCKVFVPRGSAVTEVIGGQTYCFCGRACAEKFQKLMAAS